MHTCVYKALRLKSILSYGDNVSVNISHKVICCCSQLKWPKMNIIAIKVQYLHYLMCKNSEESIQVSRNKLPKPVKLKNTTETFIKPLLHLIWKFLV